jgi:hypothetical protein
MLHCSRSVGGCVPSWDAIYGTRSEPNAPQPDTDEQALNKWQIDGGEGNESAALPEVGALEVTGSRQPGNTLVDDDRHQARDCGQDD